MIKLEDFSKEVLISVIRNTLFSRERDILWYCVDLKYRIEFEKVSKEVDRLIERKNKLQGLETLEEWFKLQERVESLFKKEDDLMKWHKKAMEELAKEKK